MQGWNGDEHITIEGVKIARSKVKPADQWCEWPRLWVDAADIAKIVRKRIKAEFPGVKFRVTTSKYAGGSSVRVAWVDGPTVKQVDAVVQRFAGATFNGMQDIKEHKPDSLIDGVQVSWGADYVMTDRDYSKDVREELRSDLRATIAGFDAQPGYEQDAAIYRVLCARDLREGAA